MTDFNNCMNYREPHVRKDPSLLKVHQWQDSEMIAAIDSIKNGLNTLSDIPKTTLWSRYTFPADSCSAYCNWCKFISTPTRFILVQNSICLMKG